MASTEAFSGPIAVPNPMKASTMPVTVPSRPSIGAILPHIERLLSNRRTARTRRSSCSPMISCRPFFPCSCATSKTALMVSAASDECFSQHSKASCQLPCRSRGRSSATSVLLSNSDFRRFQAHRMPIARAAVLAEE